MGWDADVVAEVEQMRFRGLAATPLRYAATGLRQYYRQWRQPNPMTVEVPGVLEPTPGCAPMTVRVPVNSPAVTSSSSVNPVGMLRGPADDPAVVPRLLTVIWRSSLNSLHWAARG
jgi:hypothetical protein